MPADWIMKFTSRRLWLFLLINILVDGSHVVFFHPRLVERGVYRLINITSWQVFLLMFGASILLYLFQLWLEGADTGERSSMEAYEFELPQFKKKGKVR